MKPKRIILVRHGESEGNVDKTIYKHKPDYSLLLTSKGEEQAMQAGRVINSIIKDESSGVYCSPFYRTRATRDLIEPQLAALQFSKEDPRLREQEWSTLLRRESYIEEEKERDELGHFYYRFKNGESCADVFDRMATFLDTLFRDFDKINFPRNCIIVGHGMANRVLLMKWLHLSIEEFEVLRNPENGKVFYLEFNSYSDKYVLKTELDKYPARTSKF